VTGHWRGVVLVGLCALMAGVTSTAEARYRFPFWPYRALPRQSYVRPEPARPPLPPPRPSIPEAPFQGPPIPRPAAPIQGPPIPRPAAPVQGPPIPSATAPATVTSAQACLARLAAAGFNAAAVPPPPAEDPNCTIADPVRLEGLSGAAGPIALPDRPIVGCATAEVFAAFVSDLLVPLSRGTFGQPPVSIGTGPGFECRPRNGVRGAKLSVHGQGLALDIAQLRLADASTYIVGSPRDERDRRFDRAVRAAACGYFHTVLGPGADEAHAHHWHMDLEPRGASGGSKFCQ